MKLTPEHLQPLPPVPPKDPFAQQKQHWQSRPALGKKTTNLKVSTKDAKRAGKPTISSPVLQDSTNASVAIPSRPTTSNTAQGAKSPQTSTADAADLSRRITNLMTQAAAQEEQTKAKADAYAVACARAPPLGKLSPLERGRNAFAKATRAIKGRLGSSDSNRPSSSKRPLVQRHSSFHELGPLGPPPQYESQEELSRVRLDRRIAEGENLSNPKIKSLIGDGNIPRKPLPVYETMRSRSMRSLPANDLFSDDPHSEAAQSSQDHSHFDINFSRHKNKSNTAQTNGISEGTAQESAGPRSSSRFNNMISGLAQHTDTMHFSSPPVDHSTPKIRLEPYLDKSEENQDQLLLTRSPSLMEFSFEDQSDHDTSNEVHRKGHEARASDGSSLSIKRKGATDDLRSQLVPAAKKAKTDSTDSKADSGLAIGISDLDTGDDRAPLSPKSVNIVRGQSHGKMEKRRGRGMSIFDIGKAKQLESGEDRVYEKAYTRLNAIKRTSSARPSSMLFSRGRESRNGMQRLDQDDDDAMDIDELQLDDGFYQVGRKKG